MQENKSKTKKFQSELVLRIPKTVLLQIKNFIMDIRKWLFETSSN